LAKKVILVGAGPGSEEYVTPAAKKAVRKATLVIGAQRVLGLFKEDIRGETCILRAQNLDEVLKRTLASAKEDRPVALVSTGDPTFYGLLRPLLKRSPADLEIELVPGISSIQVCAARLKICLDEIEHFLSFHGGLSTGKKRRLVDAVRRKKLVMILPDPRSFQPNRIAEYLMKAGISRRMPAVVCENLTYPNEKIRRGDLLTLSTKEFAPMCIMVVGATTSGPTC